MHGFSKFCQRGSNSDNLFLVDEGREDPNTTKTGPSSARQRNADNGTTLNAGLVALRFFSGSGPVVLGNPFAL